MSLQIGQPVPDFGLFNSEKEKIRLSDFKGKPVLLLFFPLAFTSVCTEELCSIRDLQVPIDTTKVQVLGISVDSLHTLAKYKSELKISFPLLSDFNKEVSRSFDTLYDLFAYEMRGVSKRSAFLVDKDGILRYAEVLENAGKLPDFEAIAAVLSPLIQGPVS